MTKLIIQKKFDTGAAGWMLAFINKSGDMESYKKSLDDWGCKIVTDPDTSTMYLEFDDDKKATDFILRWVW